MVCIIFNQGKRSRKGEGLALATRTRPPFSIHTGKDRGKVELVTEKHDKERPHWVLKLPGHADLGGVSVNGGPLLGPLSLSKQRADNFYKNRSFRLLLTACFSTEIKNTIVQVLCLD